MAGQGMLRLLPSRYGDGVFTPRTQQTDGSPLPSARRVSTTATTDSEAADDRFTLSVMQWGQFVDHDLALTPIFTLSGGAGIACCTADGQPLPAADTHPQCFAIDIPADDPFYGPLGVRCMDFVRSLPAEAPACGATTDAQQQDVLTHYLDGSQIYGSSLEQQTHLRELSGGRLKSQAGTLLPVDGDAFCANATMQCFEAGDERVNEQVSLTLAHTIWLREHNRIAAVLATKHPAWNDERLFQETRRIVIAEYQHITYNEWLPTLLDLDYLSRNELLMDSGTSHSFKYRREVKALITNAFATAALRFGHSLVSGTIGLFSSLGVQTSSVMLRDVFFDPHLLYDPQRLTQLARGLAAQRTQKLDGNFASDLTEHLFEADGASHGLDLVALNIQRGRDHGLGTYNDAREATGRPRATSWADLQGDMTSAAIEALQSVYQHVDDVDLFIGGVLEQPIPHVMLGRTFSRLIGDQFIRLRHGDNFFYDLGGSERPWRLSGAQLEQVRRASWARVLCDNVADVTRIQPLAFRTADSGSNAVTSCGSQAIPQVDLGPW
ncbi:Chorion peroxidase [Amphibalanus amphitrite]|uniref:Chorion peroxidase n=1 Tax=Amphibalanus amphitrite TaxID=1232801 RepID=A0A6A4VAY4_AMPAM|nr:Chorion peroxidase [Amphibalanus amphitrite]